MNVEGIIELSGVLSIVFKIFGFFIAVFYILYSLVIKRQVESMKKVVMIKDQGLLLLISYIQLLLGILLLIVSLLFL